MCLYARNYRRVKRSTCSQCQELPSYKYIKPQVYTVIKFSDYLPKEKQETDNREKSEVCILRLYNVYPSHT